MKRKRTELDEAIHYGLEYGLFDSPQSQGVLRTTMHGVRVPELEDLLTTPVDRHRERVERGQVPPFRPARTGREPVQLGEDGTNQKPVSIAPQVLPAGCLIGGNTGASKTTFVTWILFQLLTLVRGMWAADLYKSDLRRLQKLSAQTGRDVIVLPVREGRWNPLQCDGDPHTHQAWMTSLLARAIGLPDRARQLVGETIRTLYHEYGIYQGRKDQFPTLIDVYERVRANKSTNAAARDAAVDRLSTLLGSLPAATIGWRQAWRPRDLAEHAIVFELRGVSEPAKELLLSYLLFSVLYDRAEAGVSNAKLNLVVALEDAQRFLTSSRDAGDVAPMDELAGLIRGMGVGIVAAVQSMEGLSPRLIPNLSTKFMGRCGSHSDYQRMGQDMGLNAAQIQWAKLNLKPGLLIGSCADGPWRHPFLLKTPHFQIHETVSDAEVKASQQLLLQLPTQFATEYTNWNPYTTPAPHSASPATTCPIDDTELRFLLAVAAQPGLASGLYAATAKIKAQRAIQARKALVALGLLREHRVTLKAKGRPSIVLELTTEGERFLNTWGSGHDRKGTG